jgi:hypothetical protein
MAIVDAGPVSAMRVDGTNTDAGQAEDQAAPVVQGIGEATVNTKTQVWSWFRCGLPIAGAITMWISAVPISAASTADMTRPMANIQAGLGKLLDCQWQGSEVYAVCPTKQIA